MKQAGAAAKERVAGAEFWRDAELRLREEKAGLETALATQPLGELSQQLDERNAPAEEEICESEYARREALQQRLRSVQEALHRIKARNRGLCTRCGKTIGFRRLAFDPAVALCVACQTAGERSAQRPTL